MSDQQTSSVGGVGEGHDGKRSPLLASTAQRAPAVAAAAAFPPPQRSLEEEGPTMRSVAILGAPVGGAGPIGLQRGAGLHISKPTHFGGQLQKSAPVLVTTDKSHTSTAAFPVSKWSVGRLEALPDDFPLERTSRRISSITGSVVATRINDCLVTRSIEAVYNDVEAKAKCRTSDYVSFRIRLFSDGEDGVVVEVQRRRGSSFKFMKDCRAILDSAEGRNNRVQLTSFLPALKPISGMACLKGVKIDPPSTEEPSTVSAVKATEDLLALDQRDTNMLGMQNLEELTNPVSTSEEAVRLAAKSVVSEDSNSTIRGAISSLLEFNSLQNEEGYHPAAKDENDVDFNERMHNLSLSVVHNALSSMADEGSLSQHFKSHEDWFHDILIPVLVRDVESAKERPHDACMAAKCIHCLAGCAPSVRESIMGAGALHALAKARSFGAGNHASLAEVAEQAAGLLKCQ